MKLNYQLATIRHNGFEGVFLTIFTITLIFCLLDLINSIIISGSVGILQDFKNLDSQLAKRLWFYKLRYFLISVWPFDFFLSILLSLAVAKTSRVDFVLEAFWLGAGLLGVFIGRSEKISLKIPILLALLFLIVNLFISKD